MTCLTRRATAAVPAVLGMLAGLSADGTGSSWTDCLAGQWPQVLSWPDGHRDFVCTDLPPDPSLDWGSVTSDIDRNGVGRAGA